MDKLSENPSSMFQQLMEIPDTLDSIPGSGDTFEVVLKFESDGAKL